MNIKKWSERPIGIVLLSIIPAVITYVGFVEGLTGLAAFKRMDKYYPLFYALIVFVCVGGILVLRRYFIASNAKQAAAIQEIKSTLEGKASVKAVMDCMTQISNLWEERTKLQNEFVQKHEKLTTEVESFRATQTLLQKGNDAAMRTIVAVVNAANSEAEIAKMAEILYGQHPIPDLESIGIKGEIISRMKVIYHTNKVEENGSSMINVGENERRLD